MTDSTFFKTLVIGPCATNCYLFRAGDTVVVIDPGGVEPKLLTEVEVLMGTPPCKSVTVLLTHTHADHFLGADILLNAFPGSSLLVSGEDEPGLYDAALNVSQFFGLQLELKNRAAVQRVGDGDKREIGPYAVEVVAVPGHTRGGVAFVLREQKAVFSGDTLFCGDIGRSDLPGGDGDQLMRAIRDRLCALPDDFRVYPGHGPATTIRREKWRFVK
jgi:glyoxylase-like metal-dependent hydrolase (beta-lactamase superfamily II)